MKGGIVDIDNPVKNALVWVNRCSGAIIASDAVLTAAHCSGPRPDPNSPKWDSAIAVEYFNNRLIVVNAHGDFLVERDFFPSEDLQYLKWRRLIRAPDVKCMSSSSDGLLYAITNSGHLLVRPSKDNYASWEVVATNISRGIAAIAADGDYLYAANESFRLIRWNRTNSTNVDWQDVGHAENVTAMSAYDGTLYAASSNGGLWQRAAGGNEINWELIGHARNVKSMAISDQWLFAVSSDNRFWKRALVPYDEHWTHIGGWPIDALAGHQNILFGTSRVQRGHPSPPFNLTPLSGTSRVQRGHLFSSRPFVRWRYVSTHPGVTSITKVRDKLWVVTDGNLSHFGMSIQGAEITGFHEFFPRINLLPDIRSIAGSDASDELWAVTEDGELLQWPRTQRSVPWRSRGSAEGINGITLHRGYLYGTTDTRMVRRNIQIDQSDWEDLPNGQLSYGKDLTARGDSLVLVSDNKLWRKSTTVEPYKIRKMYPYDWERPGVWYPLQRPFPVKFGLDADNPIRSVNATHYSVAGFSDIMALRLEESVDDVVEPANVLIDEPSDWSTMNLYGGGYGAGNKIVLTASLEDLFSEFETMETPWQESSTEFDIARMTIVNNQFYGIDNDGNLRFRPMSDITWTKIQPTSSTIIAITGTESGLLFFVDENGEFFSRPANEEDLGWSMIGSQLGVDIRTIASAGNIIYAVDNRGQLLKRRESIFDAAPWWEVDDGAQITSRDHSLPEGPMALVAYDNYLLLVSIQFIWRKPIDDEESDWERMSYGIQPFSSISYFEWIITCTYPL